MGDLKELKKSEELRTIKRDNTVTPFDKHKIEVAIEKAMKDAKTVKNYQAAKRVAEEIENELQNSIDKIISIYEIEEKVFNKLVDAGEKATARAYEGYKSIRAFQREKNTTDTSIISLVQRRNDKVMTENSNKDAIINSTQRDLIAGEVSKDIALRKILPPKLARAHLDGAIHIHDLDYMICPMTNCCLINIKDMLDNGTVINKKQIQPPKSFQVACTVMTQIIAQVASNQYGGQSVNIEHLGKYVKISRDKYRRQLEDIIKDKDELEKTVDLLTRKEVKSGVQTIQYQVNTLN